MKKFIVMLLTLMLLIGSTTFASTSDDIHVFVNNSPLLFDVNPTIIEGRTVLPVRAIFESLGLEVGWDDTTKTVTGTGNGVVIKLQIDQVNATVNGKEFILDVPATIISGRTLVPARFVAEATGATVGWNSSTRTISIDESFSANSGLINTSYKSIEVDGGDLSGHREANVVVDIGFGSRNYFAFTNEYGQLVRVTADEIILQDDTREPVLSNGRYYENAANVPGTESSTLDKGHIIADSLGGVANAYNITPQDSVLNSRGDQAYMEKIIQDSGGCTDLIAVITYPNTATQIPSHYSYTYTINGFAIHDEFDNVNPDVVNAIIDDNDEKIVSAGSSSVSILSVGLESEQVIIKNDSSVSVQMKGYTLVSVRGNQVFIFPDYLLDGSKTVTVYSGKGSGDLKWTGSYMWNNDGDPAELYDPNGNLISNFSK
ncbi:MAG: lamin tail domain-containing protein [Clostridiales bacterium]|nr:lamin tail domain-containing protein [Clostridiales bacterium]